MTHASLAWPTVGRCVNPDSHLALSVVSSLLTAPAHSIVFASTMSPLDNVEEELPQVLVSPLHHAYTDHGFFGFLVTGCSGQAVAKRLMQARYSLGQLAVKGLSDAQFERAK